MILDLADGYFLRQAAPSDHPALCMICLRTGDAGRDATSREDDPDLLGLIYAVPYQVLEPDLAFVVEGANGPAGYLFGARDTSQFNARLVAEWYPILKQRISPPPPDKAAWRGSDWARHRIHRPHRTVSIALAGYPSHGHIDLLPEVRGRGVGRLAIGYLEQELRRRASPGLHFEVDPRNRGARRFYQQLGFTQIVPEDQPDELYFAKRLG